MWALALVQVQNNSHHMGQIFKKVNLKIELSKKYMLCTAHRKIQDFENGGAEAAMVTAGVYNREPKAPFPRKGKAQQACLVV